MTTKSIVPEQNEDETYTLVTRIQLKESENPYTEKDLLLILDILQNEITENSLGKLLDSYIDDDGVLIIAYETPKIVGKFLWAASESCDKALISDKTRETWQIDRTVTYDDFKGLAIRK